MKNIPLILLALGLVLGCNNTQGTKTPSSSASQPTNSTTDMNPSPEATPIAIESKDLVKAYKENELAADEKYEGKKLEVTGKITNIAKVLRTIQVDLEGDGFATVKCAFEESEKAAVAKLKTGQTATLIGTGDGMTSTLYAGLQNCSVK